MTTKLNQIIAKVSGVKSRQESTKTQLHHILQKKELFNGLKRDYQPKDDDGERLPSEEKKVQATVPDIVGEFKKTITELLDIVALQDNSNCEAKADVKVDGQVLLEKVPVTYLLFLEKQLIDLHTFVSKIPTLDPSKDWVESGEPHLYKTPKPSESFKTKKILQNHEKAPATKEHPAQVETYTEDVNIGKWFSTAFSGEIFATEKQSILDRIHKLQDAVKEAREEGNLYEVKNNVKYGEKLLNYVFK